MPDIHSIRLRHPWQRESLGERIRWSRSFNWPAGLTPTETARIVIDNLLPTAAVSLNGASLAVEQTGTFDVTELLNPSNQLAIELVDSLASHNVECPFDVRLEIVDR